MKKTLLIVLFCVSTTMLLAQSVSKTMLLLPDTGQTKSYTATFGEDNDYNINVPSYTDNGNGTITDNVTGLMWQQTDGGEMTIENAITYCDNLTLAGYSDWRLPTPMEAFSILNLQNVNPAINTTYFTLTTAEYWWTSVYQAGDATKVWCTNAGGGIGNKPKSETISATGTFHYHARAVRNTNTPTTITNHFTDNGDETITDNLTKLIWQKVPNTTALTWEQALSYAKSLTLAGATDWRLPNIKELQSLNNELATNPSVFTPYFSSLGVKKYWSSTTLKPNTTNPSSAWFWDTQFGLTSYDTKTNTDYVICVRGMPTLAINEAEHAPLKTVFPNPFKSTINLKSATGNEKFQLYSNLGQLIYSGTAIEKQDFSGLKTGVYFLKISDKTTTTIKLLKE